MNHYEARQEARRERLEARAERLQREAAGAFKRADLSEAATGIPFGQPILVGHHSEKRHRATIDRANRALDKGIALQKAAQEVAGRAASVGEGGISSDDPDAIVKLETKLAELEKQQAQRKAINAAIRKHAKAGSEAQIAAVVALGFGAIFAQRLLLPDFAGRVGIPSYSLTNAGANIRRVKERIEHLKRAAGRERSEVEKPGGVRIVANPELNRLQVFFPDKPDAAIRGQLKQYGFRWSPSEGAWQRHLGANATWAAGVIAEKYAGET